MIIKSGHFNGLLVIDNVAIPGDTYGAMPYYPNYVRHATVALRKARIKRDPLSADEYWRYIQELRQERLDRRDRGARVRGDA